LQVTGCTICGEAHETGQCIPTEENTQEIHYMGKINSDKGILKEDSQASSRVPIINKDSRGHTLAASSTKTRVGLQIGQSNKDLTYSRGLLSWRTP